MQITGFLLPGEVVGLDSLSDERHNSHAIALEDSEVCVIRLDEMDELAPRLPVLQTQLRRLMGKEITRSHQLVMTLGSLRSDQRPVGRASCRERVCHTCRSRWSPYH